MQRHKYVTIISLNNRHITFISQQELTEEVSSCNTLFLELFFSKFYTFKMINIYEVLKASLFHQVLVKYMNKI